MKIILKRYVPFLIALSLLICVTITLSITGYTTPIIPNNNGFVSTSEKNFKPTYGEYYNIDDEMMAIWVPYMSLDVGGDYSEEEFKKNFEEIIKNSKQYKINTLIVHIRPFSDSFYPSDYFPTSHILTGTQGKITQFDALKYMIDECHKANMEFHAWINPLRIQVNDTPKTLSKQSPYTIWTNDDITKNDDYIMKNGNDLYLNPAYEEVRKYIIDAVKEIVLNYAVDAIHFDDYFYPTTSGDIDEKAYNEYKNSVTDGYNAMTQKQWRTENINSLISGVYTAIHQITNEVEFGISPQCNIQNDIAMGADVYSWGSVNGYVDYLCPQTYVNFEHTVLPFDQSVDEWVDLVTNKNVKLYLGLALYKAGSDDDLGTWENYDDILKKQIEYGREKGVDGFMIYSYDYLNIAQTQKEVNNAMSII